MRTGYIKKRGKIWWGRITKDGITKEASLETENKGIARDRLTKWVRELEATQWGAKPKRTFESAAVKFAEEHFPVLRPASAKRYVLSMDHLLDHLGTIKLDDIGTALLGDFVSARRKAGVTNSTIRRDLACLSSIFSRAEEWEWIDRNPVKPFLRGQAKHGLREAEGRTRYLSQHEEDLVLKNAPPGARDAIAFAIDTGLRREEQFSLLLINLRLPQRELIIRGEHAKNHRERVVPLLPRALEIAKRAAAKNTRFVFETQHGNRFSKTSPTVWDALQKACRRSAIAEHVEWHDLRRTCGCRLLQDHGMKIHEVSTWLGHSDVKVTQSRYAFLKSDRLHEAVGNVVELRRPSVP